MKGFATMNSKIYSRPRIRLPKIFFSSGGDKNLKRKQKIVKIFIIMVIAFSTVKIVLDAISPIFDALCEDKAKSIATIISNNEATNVMKDHTYDELFTIEKDNDGNKNQYNKYRSHTNQGVHYGLTGTHGSIYFF